MQESPVKLAASEVEEDIHLKVKVKAESNPLSRSPSSRARGSQSPNELNSPASPYKFNLQQRNSKSSIEEPTATEQIVEAKGEINELIENLDQKLQECYRQKEMQMIERYKRDIIEAHRNLTILKGSTNEQQIRNEMNEKSLQLKKERLELIQTNMYYSNQCAEYKKTLDKCISDGGQLDRELRFLETQLNNSNRKKMDLMSDLYEKTSSIKHLTDEPQGQEVESLPLETHKKAAGSNSRTKKSSLSTYAHTEHARNVMSNSNSQKRLLPINQEKRLQYTDQVKRLFDNKLSSEHQSHKLLPGSKNGHSSHRNTLYEDTLTKTKTVAKLSKLNSMEGSRASGEAHEKIHKAKDLEAFFNDAVAKVKNAKSDDRTAARGEEFSDHEKKSIMKAFLEKEEVKKLIYSIIFEKADSNWMFKKKGKQREKVKISYNAQN